MRQARDRQSHSKKKIWISKFIPNISKFFQSQLSEYVVKIKCLNSKKRQRKAKVRARGCNIVPPSNNRRRQRSVFLGSIGFRLDRLKNLPAFLPLPPGLLSAPVP
jgi:hypothetical protein